IDSRELRLQPADHVGGTDLALRQRLQVNLNSSAVYCRVGSINPDERGKRFDRGISQNRFRKKLLPLGHCQERDVLWRLGNSQNYARILHREKSFGHVNVEKNRTDQRGRGDQQRNLAVLQHELQRAPVKRDHSLEYFFRFAVEPGLFFFRLVAQQFGAHHRRQRQRNKRGDQDGDGQSNREFPKQPPHDITHEEQRNQHGNQRNRQRNDGETDLFGAAQGRLHRRIALFNVAADILNHHDRVVDDESRRNRQRHQRKIIQRIAQKIHHPESADNGERHRHARNNRRAYAAQEQKDHHHHQGNGQHQRELHIRHRRANRVRAVRQYGHPYGGRERRLQLRQKFLHSVHDADDVRARLPLNVQYDRGLLVGPRGLAHIFRAVNRGSHVAQAYRRTVAKRDDHRAVAFARKQLVMGADSEGLFRAIKRALGLIDVRRAQRRTQILKAQTVRSQRGRIGLHAHRGPLASTEAHQPHARELRNLLRQRGVRQVLHFGERQRLRSNRQGQNGRIGGIDLAVDRRIGKIFGEKIRRAVDLRLHFLLRNVNVEVQVELQGNQRTPERTRRGHLQQAGNLPEVALQRSGHRRSHHVGACAGIKRLHLNGRIIHLRQRRNRQLQVGYVPHQQDAHHQKCGGDRPQDERP